MKSILLLSLTILVVTAVGAIAVPMFQFEILGLPGMENSIVRTEIWFGLQEGLGNIPFVMPTDSDSYTIAYLVDDAARKYSTQTLSVLSEYGDYRSRGHIKIGANDTRSTINLLWSCQAGTDYGWYAHVFSRETRQIVFFERLYSGESKSGSISLPYSSEGYDLFQSYSSVPEPSSMFPLVMGIGLLTLRRPRP